ncbi:hypothetical protein LJK87_30935 [Paenibacillus sp. P25]|nr:hypothetical protein LJK87_30935 [Paenibacillus sp. P25]
MALTLRKETVSGPACAEKAAILREYEDYAYQIAFYLLQDAAMARKAAEQASLQLFGDDSFFGMPVPRRPACVKAEAMRRALQEKSKGLARRPSVE